jgi:hypothetical protein
MSEEIKPQVVDLGTFINLLTEWHKAKVQFLNHLKAVPEGVSITIDDGEDIVLTGELLRGYQIGLGLALSELGSFPISKGLVTEIPDLVQMPEGDNNGTIH